MNFMEAVAEMRKGKEVKRKDLSWKLKQDNQHIKCGDIATGHFEATDWEVVDTDEDWNLAEHSCSDSELYIKEYIVKCRDLIIKDIKKHLEINCYNDSTTVHINHIIQMVDSRFGELK